MTEQIHKRLIDEQVRMILERYLKKEISAKQGMYLLGLKRRQFFKWVKRYKEQGEDFSIECKRSNEHKRISEVIEEKIQNELKIEKSFIEDPALPIRFYNYSYIRDQLRKKYEQEVSLPTIIGRAKKKGFIYQDQRRSSMTGR
ncbi:MAG: hypothetical protein HZB54_09010 [Deltaproteobacteria bacterium]|nr:hypothetical protein [Deltaproteobacteria bacterium]